MTYEDFPASGYPMPALKEAIKSIQCRYPVGLGHGGVVEGGVDEVAQAVGLPLLGHDGLADVDDFRCLFPEAVDAEDRQGFAVKENLEHADRVPGDLGAGQGAEVGVGDLVRDLGGGEFALVPA